MNRIAQAAFALLVLAGVAQAQEITILVAQKGTPAYENAKSMADDKSVFAERKLHKALDQAAELIAANKSAVVNIKVSAGEHEAKGGSGGWSFPEVIAPEATLRLLGGYDDTFKVRAPFMTATFLPSGAPVFAMQGKKHALKEFYFSGFMLDVASSNSYDGATNSLLKGSSASNNTITIGYLTTDRLVIADNVFLNSSHKAAAPLIRAMTKDAQVIVRNNFVINNVLAWEVKSSNFRNKPAVYLVEGNSFIMNWPYNPDPTTANPAALEIGNKYTAEKVVIKDNLFAHNVGGAIYPEYEDKIGPPMEIKHNLFFNNGTLFGLTEPGAGAVVGKFGGFLSREIPWNVLDIETVEDDYDWESEDNVVLDPKAPVTLVEPGFANSNDVQAKKSVMNDLRSLLGKNLQGGKVKISNYAPRCLINMENLPFPQEEKAKAFGVSPERVEQF